MQNKHFRNILLFYILKGKKSTEAHKAMFAVDCLTESTCHNLFKKIRYGDGSLDGGQRSGRPFGGDDDKMKALKKVTFLLTPI